MSSTADPYCCVDRNGHIWHHCVHRSIDDAVEKAKEWSKVHPLDGKSYKAIKSILDGETYEQFKDSQ